MEEFIKKLKLGYEGSYNSEEDSYIIDLPNSDAYGNVYIKLENNSNIELLDENQLITEEGSSLLYEGINEPFLINLLADWEANKYQVIINSIGE